MALTLWNVLAVICPLVVIRATSAGATYMDIAELLGEQNESAGGFDLDEELRKPILNVHERSRAEETPSSIRIISVTREKNSNSCKREKSPRTIIHEKYIHEQDEFDDRMGQENHDSLSSLLREKPSSNIRGMETISIVRKKPISNIRERAVPSCWEKMRDREEEEMSSASEENEEEEQVERPSKSKKQSKKSSSLQREGKKSKSGPKGKPKGGKSKQSKKNSYNKRK